MLCLRLPFDTTRASVIEGDTETHITKPQITICAKYRITCLSHSLPILQKSPRL